MYRSTTAPLSILTGALAIALSFWVTPAKAQATPTLAQLAAQVTALQTQVNTLQTEGTSLMAEVNSQKSAITTLQTTVASQQSTISAELVTIKTLQTKTAPLTVRNGVGTNTELFITGVNVHIVNGLGATDGNPNDPLDFSNDAAVNGLGNLIIGYNETRSLLNVSDVRTGSHNLILGDLINYSSYGGMIAGYTNTVSAPYSSVLGGSFNLASGPYSVVGAGFSNTAAGSDCAVLGGYFNTANAPVSSIGGGNHNTTNGQYSEIAGGFENLIDSGGLDAAIAGSNNQEINTEFGFLP